MLYSVAKVFYTHVKEGGVVELLETYLLQNKRIDGEEHITKFRASLRGPFLSYETRFSHSTHTCSVHASSFTTNRLRQIMGKKKQKTVETNSSFNELSKYLANLWPFTEAKLDDESFDIPSWWKQYKTS